MKVDDFNKRLTEIPRYVAVFEVIRVPKWAMAYGVEKEDLLYWDERQGSFYFMRMQKLIGLSSTHVKFHDYWAHALINARIREYQSLFKKAC